MFQLKDGKGRGYLAEVNIDNHLVTKSILSDNIHYRSVAEGDVYLLPMEFKQISGGTAEFAGILTYTGSRTLVMHKLFVSTSEANTTVTEIMAATVMTSGGIAIDTVNMNTFSSKTLGCTLLHQNEGANPFTPYFAGGRIFKIYQNGPCVYELDVYDAFILKPNYPLAIRITCDTTDSLVRCSTTAYEMDEF
jgi:hypothetical protein